MACPALATARTGTPSQRARLRLSSTPNGTPVRITAAVETATSLTCSVTLRTITALVSRRCSIESRCATRR